MRTGRFARILGAAALIAGIATTQSAVVIAGAGAAGASVPAGATYNCSGGNVPPGVYQSMVITGVCYMPFGNVIVRGNLTVAPGALLDNGTPGDPTASPQVSADLFVGRNVTVGKGAVLLLGCTPNGACSPPLTPGVGISTAHIGGNLTAYGALGVVVQSADIKGNFSLYGGGGGTMGGVATGACFAATPPAPWSEDNGSAVAGNPVYSDVEDSTIGGNYTIVGMSSCWLGTLRDQIRGNATFIGNQMGDPDAMEIGGNLIDGNLTCFENAPAPQFGDGASSDLVGGRANGQYGFNVVLQNPAAEALSSTTPPTPGVGVEQHFAVSLRHLKTYFGTHTATQVSPTPIELITTEAGNTIVAQLYDFAFTGSGLVGTGTYTGGPPGQSPGEAVLSTVYPNGSSSFTAYDNCDRCSFAGQHGSVSLRAYGTVSRNGFTTGSFLITSTGSVLPSSTSPVPGLATLVGYGSFWGSGATVHVIEHLGFAGATSP
jgi:hypothetical protein